MHSYRSIFWQSYTKLQERERESESLKVKEKSYQKDKMKRVSSRQRLVSWDAFDATAIHAPDDDDDDCEEEYTDCFVPASTTIDDDEFVVGGGPSLSSESNEGVVPSTTTPAGCRKRERSSKIKSVEVPPSTATIPTIIPRYPWEVIEDSPALKLPPLPLPPSLGGVLVTTDEQQPNLESLFEDISLEVMSFLSVQELGNVMSLNRKFRQMILSSNARSLWVQHCQSKWGKLLGASSSTSLLDGRLTVQDNLYLPTATGSYQKFNANLRLMLSMTSTTHMPTQIDKSLLESANDRHSQSRRQNPNRSGTLHCHQDSTTGDDLFSYIGPVGNGDRCIRSDQPLPKPIQRKIVTTLTKKNKSCNNSSKRRNPKIFKRSGSSGSTGSSSSSSSSSPWKASSLNGFHRRQSSFKAGGNALLDILCRGAAKAVAKTCRCSSSSISQQPTYRPFVSPYVDQDGTTINVTPRMVAYFETTIMPLQQSEPNDEDVPQLPQIMMNNPMLQPQRQRRVECTAIGIATKSFHLHSRMPGWDTHSFGYHGDDGGIYHSSGGMVEQFGKLTMGRAK